MLVTLHYTVRSPTKSGKLTEHLNLRPIRPELRSTDPKQNAHGVGIEPTLLGANSASHSPKQKR